MKYFESTGFLSASTGISNRSTVLDLPVEFCERAREDGSARETLAFRKTHKKRQLANKPLETGIDIVFGRALTRFQ
jgi:hypothetical protein